MMSTSEPRCASSWRNVIRHDRWGGITDAGTVFRLAPQTGLWTETILHSFNFDEGILPEGGLIADAAGNLFGTLPFQAGCCGSIFELSPPAVAGGEWQETTLYVFKGFSDGNRPSGPLWRDSLGGFVRNHDDRGEKQQNGAGTIFKLKPPAVWGGAWTFVLLHDFGTTPDDGADPVGGLILQNGLFYSTTESGGEQSWSCL